MRGRGHARVLVARSLPYVLYTRGAKAAYDVLSRACHVTLHTVWRYRYKRRNGKWGNGKCGNEETRNGARNKVPKLAIGHVYTCTQCHAQRQKGRLRVASKLPLATSPGHTQLFNATEYHICALQHVQWFGFAKHTGPSVRMSRISTISLTVWY